jgi:hypothetical protein
MLFFCALVAYEQQQHNSKKQQTAVTNAITTTESTWGANVEAKAKGSNRYRRYRWQ